MSTCRFCRDSEDTIIGCRCYAILLSRHLKSPLLPFVFVPKPLVGSFGCLVSLWPKKLFRISTSWHRAFISIQPQYLSVSDLTLCLFSSLTVLTTCWVLNVSRFSEFCNNSLNELRSFFPSLKINSVEQKEIMKVNEMKFFTRDLIVTCCYPVQVLLIHVRHVFGVPCKENLDIDWDLPHVDNTWSVSIIISIVNLFVEREKCFARSRSPLSLGLTGKYFISIFNCYFNFQLLILLICGLVDSH